MKGRKMKKGKRIGVAIDNTNWGCIIKNGRSIGSIRNIISVKGSSISSIGIGSSLLSSMDVSEIASLLSLIDISEIASLSGLSKGSSVMEVSQLSKDGEAHDGELGTIV